MSFKNRLAEQENKSYVITNQGGRGGREGGWEGGRNGRTEEGSLVQLNVAFLTPCIDQETKIITVYGNRQQLNRIDNKHLI